MDALSSHQLEGARAALWKARILLHIWRILCAVLETYEARSSVSASKMSSSWYFDKTWSDLWGLHRKKTVKRLFSLVLTLSSPVPNTKVLTAFACKECGRFDSVGSGPKGDAMRCLEIFEIWRSTPKSAPKMDDMDGGWWGYPNDISETAISWDGKYQQNGRDGNGLTSGEAGRNEYIVVADVERHMGAMQWRPGDIFFSHFRWFLSANHPGFGICFHLTAESSLGCCQEQSRKLVDATETLFQLPMGINDQWATCSSY